MTKIEIGLSLLEIDNYLDTECITIKPGEQFKISFDCNTDSNDLDVVVLCKHTFEGLILYGIKNNDATAKEYVFIGNEGDNK